MAFCHHSIVWCLFGNKKKKLIKLRLLITFIVSFHRQNMYFHGPWYVHPQDVQHSPTRLFFRQEVFRSTVEDTNPLLSIEGRCCVLTPKEYCTSRPTEILEQDIYICESKYNETEKAIKKIPKATAVKVLKIIFVQII